MVSSRKSLKKRSSVNTDKLQNARKPCGLGNGLSSTDSLTAAKAPSHCDRGKGWRRLQTQPGPCLRVLGQHEGKYRGANLKTEYVENGDQVVLSYCHSPETPLISCYLCYLSQNKIFQDRKVAISSSSLH